MLVAAHFDDEILGAGTWLPRWPRAVVVHVTDSAPASMEDARRHGFTSRAQYTAARRAELRRALAVLEASHVELAQLSIPDQQAAFHLEWITEHLARLIADIRPALVLTHPYEGGHPDHDACAFAVRHAAGLVPAGEFTSYFFNGSAWTTGRFLEPWPAPYVRLLTPEGRSRKQAALACFATQRETLAQFDTTLELLRPAPCYDFRRPPHGGLLNYERFPWGLTGAQFRALAQQATHRLHRHVAA